MIAVQIAAVVLALLAMWRAARAAARWPPPGHGAGTRDQSPPPPGDLVRCEQLVGTVLSGGSFGRRRLRSSLRELARARLANHGVALDAQPAAARAALGDELWEIVRGDLQISDPRLEQPVTRTDLTGMLDRLEAL